MEKNSSKSDGKRSRLNLRKDLLMDMSIHAACSQFRNQWFQLSHLRLLTGHRQVYFRNLSLNSVNMIHIYRLAYFLPWLFYFNNTNYKNVTLKLDCLRASLLYFPEPCCWNNSLIADEAFLDRFTAQIQSHHSSLPDKNFLIRISCWWGHRSCGIIFFFNFS